MKRLRQKLGNRRGVSLILALLFFLICACAGAAVLAAAGGLSSHLADRPKEEQIYLTQRSAALLLRQKLFGSDGTTALTVTRQQAGSGSSSSSLSPGKSSSGAGKGSSGTNANGNNGNAYGVTGNGNGKGNNGKGNGNGGARDSSSAASGASGSSGLSGSAGQVTFTAPADGGAFAQVLCEAAASSWLAQNSAAAAADLSFDNFTADPLLAADLLPASGTLTLAPQSGTAMPAVKIDYACDENFNFVFTLRDEASGESRMSLRVPCTVTTGADGGTETLTWGADTHIDKES